GAESFVKRTLGPRLTARRHQKLEMPPRGHGPQLRIEMRRHIWTRSFHKRHRFVVQRKVQRLAQSKGEKDRSHSWKFCLAAPPLRAPSPRRYPRRAWAAD